MPQPLVMTTARLRLLRTLEATYVAPRWASSILNYIKHRARKLGEGLSEDLETYHIDALMSFQSHKCALSDVAFVLPEIEELDKRRGYMKWL